MPAAARPVAVAWILCCAAFVAIGAVIAAGQPHGNAVDRPVDSWLRSQLGGHHAGLLAGLDGCLVLLAVLATAVVIAGLAARRLTGAVLALVGILTASGLTELVLKPAVDESMQGALTYPSGHATIAFALVAVIALAAHLVPRSWLPCWLTAIILAAALAAGCAVLVALVGLAYHYFTDTLAGAAIGSSVVLAVALGLDTGAARARLAWPARSGRRG